MESQASVALVVGITGLTGPSLAQTLKKPSCPGGPWKVYGAARRPPPSWFSPSTVDHFISFDAVDSSDTSAKLLPVANEVTHLFWVTLQIHADEETNITVNKTMLVNVLTALKSATSSRLAHVTLQTGTKHYMGPIFDPVRSTQLVCHDPPFQESMPRLPYPNFYYALEDLLETYAPSIDVFAWKSAWKLFSQLFHVEFVPFDETQEFDLAELMRDKGSVWDQIVDNYGLYKTKLEEITCYEALQTVLRFKFQHVSSMNKSREYGFFGHVDTFKSIRFWLEKLRHMKIIPSYQH